MGGELGSRPSGRDVAFAVVAFGAGILALAASLGGGIAVVMQGLSFSLAVGILFNVVFWYWIAVGAWRRTIWCPTGPTTPTAPRC